MIKSFLKFFRDETDYLIEWRICGLTSNEAHIIREKLAEMIDDGFVAKTLGYG